MAKILNWYRDSYNRGRTGIDGSAFHEEAPRDSPVEVAGGLKSVHAAQFKVTEPVHREIWPGENEHAFTQASASALDQWNPLGFGPQAHGGMAVS